ncbi:hypothetical protein Pth03_56520 [Planotetraspora thailandica]|uniref:Knr4/Smi1-like domain-containing protein n=1 Tax=Planotetraspora thailandica TaxID=487172 RepID=A0A8J3V5V7_9ACTN|nr:hypothetical protein [Planotetraspora thailandica]GII57263.1 hypothetical protein Pth03_56520 [Planotetraspora thailandica]
MFDADHVRLGRIAGKLAAARAMLVPPKAFGVEAHGFKLGAPLFEAVVAEFEERHEVTLPPAYRLFVTELGDGGAGPGYGLCRLSASCCARRRSGHLAQPSPYLPGPRYLDDWDQRYEDPPGPDRIFLRGTLRIADHGCSLGTQLIVTGPARGRLLNLDYEGPVGPYVVEDTDFLAWYERWLDEAIAGYDVGWFGERLPLEEPELVAVLADDPSPERRARAGNSLLQLPAISDSAWTALVGTMTTDVDATVRAEVWDLLRWQRHKHQRRLDNAEAIADDVARYARSCTPPDLNALGVLRRLTFTDVLPELACHDLERRRRAAYQLARQPWEFRRENLRQDLLDDVVGGLLGDADPLPRSHGVAVVRWFGLTHLHPLLRDLQETETDPWVQHHLSWCLSEQPTYTWDESLTSAAREWSEQPPF